MSAFKNGIWIGCLLLAAFLTACWPFGSLSQLKKMKSAWGKQDYETVAEEAVSCKPSEEGCNQLHLLKGDACFRLAKENRDPRRHYACAADELEEGIRQTRNWQATGFDLNRPQSYENLSESLRQWQDFEKGAAADALTQRLLKVSESFLQAEPGNLAGIYFETSARLTLLRGELLGPAHAPALCQQLNALLRPLEEAQPKAKGTRYEVNYDRLRSDLLGAKQMVPACT